MSTVYTVPEHPANHVDTFDSIVAAWSLSLNCEMTTEAGARCQRQAHWRLDLHGCEQALLCGQHLKAWRRDALSRELSGLAPECNHCGCIFRSVDDAYTVVAL